MDVVLDKILFASDSTHATNPAEAYTVHLARTSSAKVTVLHAVEPIEGAGDDSAVERFVERKAIAARKGAEVVAERMRSEGVEVDVQITIGKRWKVILDHAKAGEYDLVVLGAHAVKDGEKVYMGTTTQKVFFAADMPLLVVPV